MVSGCFDICFAIVVFPHRGGLNEIDLLSQGIIFYTKTIPTCRSVLYQLRKMRFELTLAACGHWMDFPDYAIIKCVSDPASWRRG